MFRIISDEDYNTLFEEIRSVEKWAVKLKMLGLKLLVARRELAFNQVRFGHLLGVSYMKIHRWENGLYAPSCLELLKICYITGKTPEYFFKD